MTADQVPEAFLAEHGHKSVAALYQQVNRLHLEDALRVLGGNPFVSKLTFRVALGGADYHLTVERYDFVEDDDRARQPSDPRFFWDVARADDDFLADDDPLTSPAGWCYATAEEARAAGAEAIHGRAKG